MCIKFIKTFCKYQVIQNKDNRYRINEMYRYYPARDFSAEVIAINIERPTPLTFSFIHILDSVA